MQRNDRPRRWREPELWYGALTVALAWLGLCMIMGVDITGHSGRDSFTLMALAWRKGRLSLGQDYPWLELAIYKGDWYVSFPSVPALVMLPLTFIFGEYTPNTLVNGLYFIGSYAAAYCLARHYRSRLSAMLFGLFVTLGTNMIDLSLSGDVWYQGQLLSYLLMLGCALGLSADAPGGWAAGLTCLALAVGCRPFQAVYVPFALTLLYRKLSERQRAARPAQLIRAMLPYLIAPALVALALGWYNWARFGNPLEFGHNYLPEFTRDPTQPQLALKYIPKNARGLLRLPSIENGRIVFPIFDGFAFWLVNPIYTTCAIAMVSKLRARSWDAPDALLLAGFAAEALLLLSHKTFGGWQWGARYLCDLIPMMLLMQLRGRKKMRAWERAAVPIAIAVNLYGVIVFHLLDKLPA